MITFNLGDQNLDKIRVDSKLFNLRAKYSYRIYGLKLVKSNNPFDISYSSSSVNLPDPEVLVKLFKDNGIKVDLNKQDIDAKNDVYIGIRKDVRQNIILSGMLLQIIIYYFEGRLTLDPSYRLPTIPYLYEATPEKEEDEEEDVKTA